MKQEPANLVVESYQLAGARQMLLRLRDEFKITGFTKDVKYYSRAEDAVYAAAELDMIQSSMDNVRHFLSGDLRIHYRNHERDKKGRLIKVEAYFAPQ